MVLKIIKNIYHFLDVSILFFLFLNYNNMANITINLINIRYNNNKIMAYYSFFYFLKKKKIK